MGKSTWSQCLKHQPDLNGFVSVCFGSSLWSNSSLVPSCSPIKNRDMSVSGDDDDLPTCECGQTMTIKKSEKMWHCSVCQEVKAACVLQYICACGRHACDECAWFNAEYADVRLRKNAKKSMKNGMSTVKSEDMTVGMAVTSTSTKKKDNGKSGSTKAIRRMNQKSMANRMSLAHGMSMENGMSMVNGMTMANGMSTVRLEAMDGVDVIGMKTKKMQRPVQLISHFPPSSMLRRQRRRSKQPSISRIATPFPVIRLPKDCNAAPCDL